MNVIAIQNIELSGAQEITLEGAATDIFVLNVAGNISTGGGASGIYLSGGLVPKNVIINAVGAGSGISIAGADIINGTLIGQDRSINLGGANIINGAVVGNGISVGGANVVMSPQGFCGVTTPPNPTPSPSPSSTSAPSPSPSASASPAPSPSPTASASPTPSPSSSSGADCGELVCPTGPIGGGSIGI